jgi:alkanesulfonate monooxygenase SsuD/methylene tetrahydromethanopterin reductase-like flavin-dependent oxidoreductase (luciferase family)
MRPLILAALLLCLPAHAGGTSGVSLARVAKRAIRGDFGKLRPWQADAYRTILKRNIRATRLCWRTDFGAWEGQHTGCGGYHLDEYSCAANRLTQGTVIWIAGGLRRVQDTGAHYNDGIADRKGASMWIDLWWEDNPDATGLERFAVISGGEK